MNCEYDIDCADIDCVQAAASPDHSVPQLHHLGAPHPLSPGGQVITPDLYNNIVRNVNDQVQVPDLTAYQVHDPVLGAAHPVRPAVHPPPGQLRALGIRGVKYQNSRGEDICVIVDCRICNFSKYFTQSNPILFSTFFSKQFSDNRMRKSES